MTKPLAGHKRAVRITSAGTAQIVCGHFGGSGNRESNGLRYRSDRFEVSQTPGRVAIAKVPVERLVARGRCEPFAFDTGHRDRTVTLEEVSQPHPLSIRSSHPKARCGPC